MVESRCLLNIGGTTMDRQRVPSDVVVSLRMCISEPAINDGYNACVGIISD